MVVVVMVMMVLMVAPIPVVRRRLEPLLGVTWRWRRRQEGMKEEEGGAEYGSRFMD